LKKIALYPGTFDPVTNGHIDIIERCSKLFDQVIVAILLNPDKDPLFTVKERVTMLKTVARKRYRNVAIDTFDGLLVEYAVKKKATVIVRGIRAISDYEYELQMALMNRRLEPRIETVFMLPAESFSYLSSKLIREIFVLGGSVKGLVPGIVEQRLRAKNRGPMAARHRG
jgi:pantetheine-phosphate adenylyltransferase